MSLCEAMHEASMEGTDEEYGSTTEAPGRWWGLLTEVSPGDLFGGTWEAGEDELAEEIDETKGKGGRLHVIITVDTQGFKDCEFFPSSGKAKTAYRKIVREVEREMKVEERAERRRERGARRARVTKKRGNPGHDPCAMVSALRWKKVRVSAPWLEGGYDASIAPLARKRAMGIIAAFRLKVRPPRVGHEMYLGDCDGKKVWLENRAGKYEMTKRER